MRDLVSVETAIISVHDKSGLKQFVSELLEIVPSVKVISSGGTFNELKNFSNVIQVSDYTEYPEMPSGLVKTLHPKIHAGILGGESDSEYLKSNKISKIDLVVVNLYPFEKVSKNTSKIEDARLNIDIGGVSLVESGCKNFLRVAVITDPSDYASFLAKLKSNGGKTSLADRFRLAKNGFSYLSSYLQNVEKYFDSKDSSMLGEYSNG